MVTASVIWIAPPEAMAERALAKARRIMAKALAIAQSMIEQIVAYAQQYAPWTDRTGAARAGLHGFASQTGATSVTLVLAHSVYYGIYLERSFGGRFAIIMDALQTHYAAVMRAMQGVFAA